MTSVDTDTPPEAPAPAPAKHYAHHLQVSQHYNLMQAAQAVVTAFDWSQDSGFFGVYHVGSSLMRAGWRDVDARAILSDERFDRMFPDNVIAHDGFPESPLLSLFNVAISEWMSARTGLPIDFQFQRQTQANAKYSRKDGHLRSALGVFLPARRADGEPA